MCPSGCGPLYKPGIDLTDTTCPCGYGYFDRSGYFVSGDRVRSGSAPSREAYAGHDPSCPVRADPRNSHGISETSSTLGAQDEPLQSFFMPAEDVNYDVLKVYVKRDGPEASATPTTYQGNPGYLIRAKQSPNKEFFSNIKADSATPSKPRQAYEEKMPKRASASVLVSQVPEPQDSRQAFRHNHPSTEDHRPSDRHKSQYSSDRGRAPDHRTQRMPSDVEYGQSYPLEHQQSLIRGPRDTLPTVQYPPSLAGYSSSPSQYSSSQSQATHSSNPSVYQSSLFEPPSRRSLHPEPGVYPYGSTAQGQQQQPIVTDSWRSLESPQGNLLTESRTGLRQSEAYSRQTAARSSSWETRRAADTTALAGSAYSSPHEQRRAPPSAEEDPRRVTSQDDQRESESRPEQSQGRPAQPDREREARYTDPRDSRTVIASRTRRAFADPREQPHTPPVSRTEQRSTDPNDYQDEDRPRQERSSQKGHRRR